MRTRSGSRTGLMRPGVVLLLMTGLLTSGCASLTDASETERTICRELRNALPTWSVEDTEQSKREAADFLSVFSAVCPE